MQIYNKNQIEKLLSRSQLGHEEVNIAVKSICKDIKENGDKALFSYTEKFDNTKLSSENILVSQDEIADAYSKVDKELLATLRRAKENILQYHKRGVQGENLKEENGKLTGYIMKAVDRVGVYVPGGTASYPSSVLMGVLPALACGVKEIYMVTPCKNGIINPLTIVAGIECGVAGIYKIGGAQAIASLAFGTESVKKVDVIAGPGNIYVTMAKKEVFGFVGIDMLAGPSEIMIVADSSANPKFIASDMLSQAEHDILSTAILVTNDKKIAEETNLEVIKQLEKLPRKEIATKSIENSGGIILVESIEEGIEIVNKIAPEHLELCVKDPENLLDLVHNAGAIFMGNYTPEPMGDYFAGPCHILPTSATAKFFEVLNSDIFMKKVSVIRYTKEAFLRDSEDVIKLAESEGLFAHANAVKIRL